MLLIAGVNFKIILNVNLRISKIGFRSNLNKAEQQSLIIPIIFFHLVYEYIRV